MAGEDPPLRQQLLQAGLLPGADRVTATAPGQPVPRRIPALTDRAIAVALGLPLLLLPVIALGGMVYLLPSQRRRGISLIWWAITLGLSPL